MRRGGKSCRRWRSGRPERGPPCRPLRPFVPGPVALLAASAVLFQMVPSVTPFSLEALAGPSHTSLPWRRSVRAAASADTLLWLARDQPGGEREGKGEDGEGGKVKKGRNENRSGGKNRRRKNHGDGPRNAGNRTSLSAGTNSTATSRRKGGGRPRQGKGQKVGPQSSKHSQSKPSTTNLMKRVTQLEGIAAGQSVEIRKLREECKELREAVGAFAEVVELLRQAGLKSEDYKDVVDAGASGDTASEEKAAAPVSSTKKPNVYQNRKDSAEAKNYDYHEVEDVIGSAPSSVIDAADASGAAVLAALLAGKQRILVDVRDAELSRDPDMLVQFIELAVLPVAAGIEGIESQRNHVKIVFPTVSQLLSFRRTMALAGTTDIVTLSTLGFDPVHDNDSLVVLIAPSPDDEEGIETMNELISPSDPDAVGMKQPLLVINTHMVPVSGPASKFTVAYHLRLLSVQYMTGDMTPEYLQFLANEEKERKRNLEGKDDGDEKEGDKSSKSEGYDLEKESEEAIEAAMNRARDLGVHHGITRGMVIRAYPRPWHVFVDTSPDTDADFEVAATFDEEPTSDEVNYAIVECLEGSEEEEELVAQQMQAALESGQLNSVSEVLDVLPNVEIGEGGGNSNQTRSKSDEDEGLWFDDFDFFSEDTT